MLVLRRREDVETSVIEDSHDLRQGALRVEDVLHYVLGYKDVKAAVGKRELLEVLAAQTVLLYSPGPTSSKKNE